LILQLELRKKRPEFIVARFPNPPKASGATTFVRDAPRFKPTNALRAMQEVGVTTLCAPPTVWRMLIRDDPGTKPHGLRELASAGEPLEQVGKDWGLVIRDGCGKLRRPP